MDKTCIESFTHKQLKKLVEIKHAEFNLQMQQNSD